MVLKKEHQRIMNKPLESRRGQARIVAMRFMFEKELNKDENLGEAFDRHVAHLNIREGIASYARQMVLLCAEHREQIETIISAHLQNWDLKRLSLVDRSVLKIGVTEFMYMEPVPPAVTINEMVEVAKIYGSADSPGFVNGVLDAIHKTLKERLPP